MPLEKAGIYLDIDVCIHVYLLLPYLHFLLLYLLFLFLPSCSFSCTLSHYTLSPFYFFNFSTNFSLPISTSISTTSSSCIFLPLRPSLPALPLPVLLPPTLSSPSPPPFRTERDMSGWSSERLCQLLQAVWVERPQGCCQLTDVSRLDGEASINNHKGKLIFFYEWHPKAGWQGQSVSQQVIMSLHNQHHHFLLCVGRDIHRWCEVPRRCGGEQPFRGERPGCCCCCCCNYCILMLFLCCGD